MNQYYLLLPEIDGLYISRIIKSILQRECLKKICLITHIRILIINEDNIGRYKTFNILLNDIFISNFSHVNEMKKLHTALHNIANAGLDILSNEIIPNSKISNIIILIAEIAVVILGFPIAINI